VDYFSPGAREIARKLGRLLNRLRLAAQRRRLARAETELGLLGWQQADYDEETQREVEKIQNYEREQGRLTNEGAELGREIRALKEERETARKEHEETRRQLQVQRRSIAEPIPGNEKQLAALQRQEPLFEKRMPELDRELREVSKLYSQLLTAGATSAQARQELIHLRERTVAIPNEKADLRAQHMRLVSEIKSMETGLTQARQQITALDQSLRELDAAFQAADRDRAAEIKTREREKARIDKEVDALEVAKANPYEQIGRVLADSNVAPMNQPHALEKVRRQRFVIQELEYAIARSHQLSAETNPALVRISYMLWAVMLVAAAILLAVFLSGSPSPTAAELTL
jgi:chromosome segregation ATPase